jgi:hypothetical protein
VGCRVTKAGSSAELVEDLLQLGAPRNDDPGIDRPQIEQEAEVVQIAIEERVLVVPFHFQRHSVLVTVYLVRWSDMFGQIHNDFGIEFLFHPAEPREMRIQFA